MAQSKEVADPFGFLSPLNPEFLWFKPFKPKRLQLSWSRIESLENCPFGNNALQGSIEATFRDPLTTFLLRSKE